MGKGIPNSCLLGAPMPGKLKCGVSKHLTIRWMPGHRELHPLAFIASTAPLSLLLR